MKNLPPDLFSEMPYSDSGTALQLGAPATARLSPAQQRFNSLLKRIDKLKAELANVKTLSDTFMPLYRDKLEPLDERRKALMRQLALWIDERLGRKGLTPTHKRQAREVLCGLCEALAMDGDAAMESLHNKHSPHSLRAMQADQAEQMRMAMESMFGESLDMDGEHGSSDPLDAVMRAGKAKFEQARQAAEDDTVAKAKKKKPTATQRKAAQHQEDAETVLRQVYRQLASALHPDRERDPVEQKRKTTLMSEANAAYARQDMVALLHLQLRIAQIDANGLLQQPEEKIAAMSSLLKQQVAELESETRGRQNALNQALGLADYRGMPTAAILHLELRMQEEELRAELAAMEQDLQSVQDDKWLKRWLKVQAIGHSGIDFF